MDYLDDDPSPGRRRSLVIVVVSLVFIAVLVVAGVLVVRHHRQRVERQNADFRLCTNAAITLELVQPNMPVGVPTVQFRAVRTTAGRVAAQLTRAGADPHPWDQEAAGTTVVRCQSGRLLWIADSLGHAARLPTP